MVNDPLHKKLRTLNGRAFGDRQLDSYLSKLSKLSAKYLDLWVDNADSKDLHMEAGLSFFLWNLWNVWNCGVAAVVVVVVSVWVSGSVSVRGRNDGGCVRASVLLFMCGTKHSKKRAETLKCI